MPKKSMGALRNLRTAQKARLRSKPEVAGQEFLDLFILSRLKERLQREQERAEDGLKYVLKDIADVAKDAELALAEDKAAIEKLRATLEETGALDKARPRGATRPHSTARGAKSPQIMEY